MTDVSDSQQPFAHKPLICVCIATYNQQDYIRDAVMSVLAQADPQKFSLKILVGDDCSTDATPAILQELSVRYSQYINVVTHRHNVGAGKNYQALTKCADGDFIAHLDGDDCWLPGKLAAQLAFLQAHSECVAVYANAFVTDFEGCLVGRFTKSDPRPFGAHDLLAEGNFLNHSSLLYRASSAHRVLDLSTPFIDYNIHLGLARDGLLAQLPACLVVYRAGTPTSMLRTMPELVSDLYFNALLDGLSTCDDRTRIHASARYLSLSIVSAIAGVRDKHLFCRMKTLRQLAGVSVWRMAVAVGGRVTMLLTNAVRTRLAALFDTQPRVPVVHPRE